MGDTGPPSRAARADRADRVREIGALLRRLKAEDDRVATAVAAREQVGHTDLVALMHIMEGAAAGRPLTPGGLQRALGLSSGATTAVVDRLEALGHARRDRDTGDRRRVNLRYDDRGLEVGERYFGPLGRRLAEVLEDYDDAEQALVHRFLTAVVAIYAEHSRAIEDGALGAGALPGSAPPRHPAPGG